MFTEIPVKTLLSSLEGNGNLSRIGDELILFDDYACMLLSDVPYRCTGIIIGLCIHGGFSYTVDTVPYSVHAGDAFIIHGGQVLADYVPSSDIKGVGIMMSYDFYQEMVKGVHDLSSLFIFSRNHPVFRMFPDDRENVIEYFALIKKKVDKASGKYRAEVVRMLISAMIYDLGEAIYRLRVIDDGMQTRGIAIFSEFIRLVELNFRQERRVSWYSQQMCITPKYLLEAVKGFSGRTPTEWIDNYVMVELRVQLKHTGKSIKEIANEMNFPSQSFLGKYFKDKVGLSPMTYRKV